MDTIQLIRKHFAFLLKEGIFVPDKTGQKVIEILGAQFTADENTIFGKPNKDYITKEIEWYLSQSLNIRTMRPPVPKMWETVADSKGFVNGNYGYLVFSKDNYSQFKFCQNELEKNPWSRRAIMIYTRPTMWVEYNKNGRSDFTCTNTVQYFIRQNPNEDGVLRLFARVDMRSNDAWSGYRNDVAWQQFVFEYLYKKLLPTYPTLKRAAIIWCVGSLHVYERNFDLVQHFIDTGEHSPELEALLETRKHLIESGVIKK